MISFVGLRYLIGKSLSPEILRASPRWGPRESFYCESALAALVVKDFFGGRIKGGILPPELARELGFLYHYWNLLPDGKLLDAFRGRFPADFPYDKFTAGLVGCLTDVECYSGYIMASRDARRRYFLLKSRVEETLRSVPIFGDLKYQRCWELAFSETSKCKKMRFACLVYDGDRLIAEDVNRFITEQFQKERFCSLDGSRCQREGLPRRVDAAIGDCGHAPTWCLKKVFGLGYKPEDLAKLDFYEAGFCPDGSPRHQTPGSCTCVYCENMFAIFGLDKIWGAFAEGWQKLWTADSFYSSADYCLGREKI